MVKRFLLVFIVTATLYIIVAAVSSQGKSTDKAPVSQSILFIGNSFTFAQGSPVMNYHTQSVTDLNNTNLGGVPALFKTFTKEAGFDFVVNLETSPGSNLDFHLKERADKIIKPWNYVVMQGFSTLDKENPGDPTVMAESAAEIAKQLRSKNPKVDIHLTSTWARADQVYLKTGFWRRQSVEKMTNDIRRGYNVAAQKASIKDVIPVGQAWNRAIKSGIADANPFDGIEAGKINLWTYDNYHGSAYGYYIEALMVFASITGDDPACLGKNETAAKELGFTTEQTVALQKIAHDELVARSGYPPLKTFVAILK